MEKILENIFLCFHVNFKHKSKKHACFPVNFSFSAPLHHNGKGSIADRYVHVRATLVFNLLLHVRTCTYMYMYLGVSICTTGINSLNLLPLLHVGCCYYDVIMM